MDNRWPAYNIPRHLLTTEDAEILKNVVLHSVATAFASIVWNMKTVTYITTIISPKKKKKKASSSTNSI